MFRSLFQFPIRSTVPCYSKKTPPCSETSNEFRFLSQNTEVFYYYIHFYYNYLNPNYNYSQFNCNNSESA